MCQVDWNKLRDEVHEWSLLNFGKQPSEYRILGLHEEQGELCRVVLKRRQAIRDEQSRFDDEWDAIGDIAIYLMDYCGAEEVDIIAPLEDKSSLIIDNILNDLASWTSYLAGNIPKQIVVTQILALLNSYCNIQEINFESAVESTWKGVGARDWKLYPKNGVSK